MRWIGVISKRYKEVTQDGTRLVGKHNRKARRAAGREMGIYVTDAQYAKLMAKAV